MRWFVQFSYKGSDFHGSQTQPNGISVQEVLEGCFHTLLRVHIPLTFAGRTDAGVHALCMYAHFDAERIPDNLVSRLNSLLPESIAVQRVFPVSDDAHARFSATMRTYHYRITDHKDPFCYGMATKVASGLDVELMNNAAELLLGRQDFASFCKVHTDVKTTLCTIYEARWEGNIFVISADRFLRNMVRAIVGTLLDVGRRKISIEQFKDIILCKNRCSAGQSAPAEGLFLVDIRYPETIFTR